MADFPPNLDDGELWLPSDIISDVVGVTDNSYRRLSSPAFPFSDLSAKAPSANLSAKAPSAGYVYIENLARQPAAVGLLDRPCMLQSSVVAVSPEVHAHMPSPKRSSNLQGPKSVRTGLRFQPPPNVGAAYDVFRPPSLTMAVSTGDGGLGALGCGFAQVVREQPPKSVRVSDVLGRECGGTGVFIPRATRVPRRVNNGSNSKKKYHGKEGEQQLYTRNAVELRKQRQGVPFRSGAVTGRDLPRRT